MVSLHLLGHALLALGRALQGLHAGLEGHDRLVQALDAVHLEGLCRCSLRRGTGHWTANGLQFFSKLEHNQPLGPLSTLLAGLFWLFGLLKALWALGGSWRLFVQVLKKIDAVRCS